MKESAADKAAFFFFFFLVQKYIYKQNFVKCGYSFTLWFGLEKAQRSKLG